jgi:hypothetical protein
MVLTKYKLKHGYESEMPEGLSFFSRSASRDRLKEKQLCALCTSVVN